MPFIEIPVEIGTPVWEVMINQHDGAWVVLKSFDLSMLNRWSSYVFPTEAAAISRMIELNRSRGQIFMNSISKTLAFVFGFFLCTLSLFQLQTHAVQTAIFGAALIIYAKET